METEGPYRAPPPPCDECTKKKNEIWNLEEDRKLLQAKIYRLELKNLEDKQVYKTVFGLFRTVFLGLAALAIFWASLGLVIDRLDTKIMAGSALSMFLILFGIATTVAVAVVAITYEVKQKRYYGN